MSFHALFSIENIKSEIKQLEFFSESLRELCPEIAINVLMIELAKILKKAVNERDTRVAKILSNDLRRFLALVDQYE